jgi:hypothetical protein
MALWDAYSAAMVAFQAAPTEAGARRVLSPFVSFVRRFAPANAAELIVELERKLGLQGRP